MREVSATTAKARLAELLRSVEAAKPLPLRRHGKAVAHLSPAHAHERAARAAAVEWFRQRRAGWRRVEMSTQEILAARHEGHRW